MSPRRASSSEQTQPAASSTTPVLASVAGSHRLERVTHLTSSLDREVHSRSTVGGTRKGFVRMGTRDDCLPRDIRISKNLTLILRHKALDLKIEVRPDGFCPLGEVMKTEWMQELEATQQDIIWVVESSDKRRFELMEEAGRKYIRAVQGHSMKVVEDEALLRRPSLEDADLPEVCVHGTYNKHRLSIITNGLLAGGGQGSTFRNHVHFAPRPPGDKRVISGMRHDSEIAFYIDLKSALGKGVPFYVSGNEVILSPGIQGRISPEFLVKWVDLQTGENHELSSHGGEAQETAMQGEPRRSQCSVLPLAFESGPQSGAAVGLAVEAVAEAASPPALPVWPTGADAILHSPPAALVWPSEAQLDVGGLFEVAVDYTGRTEPQEGYAALKRGDRVRVEPGTRTPGDLANMLPEYVYGGTVGGEHGWFPTVILRLLQ